MSESPNDVAHQSMKRTEESWVVGQKAYYLALSTPTYIVEYTIVSKTKTMVHLQAKNGVKLRIRFNGTAVGSPPYQAYYFPENFPEVAIRKKTVLRYQSMIKIQKLLPNASDDLIKDILAMLEA